MTPRAPTPTEDFARCPIYARLRHDWEPRGAVWTPNMLLGRAIGEGMSQHYRHIKAGDVAMGSSPEAVALQTLEEGYVEQETWSLDVLRKHVKAGLKEAIATTPVQGEILLVDETLPSKARPDVVFRHPVTGLTVVDTKVRFKLDPRYRANALSDYETWWQGWHYAWEVGEVLGEPVRWIGPHLIMLTPKVTGEYYPIEVSPARVAFWLRQAQAIWERMADGDPWEPNWFSCRHPRWGLCDFYNACHIVQDSSEDKMAILYQRKRHEGPEHPRKEEME